MAVITVKVPDEGPERDEFVEDLVSKIKYGATGPFADALFDVMSRTMGKGSGVGPNGKVMIVTRPDDDSKIADKARTASVSWTGKVRDVAEAIYWEARS